MPIEGLRTAPQPEASMFNPNDEAAVATEALGMLGLVEDRDQVAESLAADFGRLNSEAGVPGEPYVQVPRSLASLPNLITALDTGAYPDGKEYPKTFVYDQLWTPGTTSGSYAATHIGNLELGKLDASWPPHARLAVHNPTNPNESLLHFLGKPFDGKYAGKREETQLQAIAKAQEEYKAGHQNSDLAMSALNTNAVAMLALTRRIKGQPMPMEWGYMNDATLPRTTVDGGSCVGDVFSRGGLLLLDGSGGYAGSGAGVGLSVGQKNLRA